MKQRLIGAAVIIALAVIFIPMLLEGPKENDPVSMQIEIPEKPVYEIPDRLGKAPAVPEPVSPEPAMQKPVMPETALKAPEVVIPAKPTVSDPAAKPEPAKVPTEKQVVIEKPVEKKPEPPVATAPAVKTKPKPVTKRINASDSGFVVQVGSFSQRQNALVLSDKLEASGYPAFVESGKSKDKTIFRVKVGPQPTRADADQLRQKLLDGEKLKGIIVAHP